MFSMINLYYYYNKSLIYYRKFITCFSFGLLLYTYIYGKYYTL